MPSAKLKPFRVTDPEFDLRQLTAAERLVLWRFRQRGPSPRLLGRTGAAMSQSEAAAALGLSSGTYAKLEQGGEPTLSAEEAARLSAALGPLLPSLGELCFIARRRSGLELRAIEQELCISRPTYHAEERIAAPRVRGYWEGRGFRFP